MDRHVNRENPDLSDSPGPSLRQAQATALLPLATTDPILYTYLETGYRDRGTISG